MNSLISENLRIQPRRTEQNVIRVDWLGRSDSRRPSEALQPYLSALIDEARELRASMEMHFEEMEFFNSSTVSVLIQVVQLARMHRIPISYNYEPTIRWQRLCFEALRVFESFDDLVRVVPLDRPKS